MHGSTSKHSMRLINTRFSNENKFFGMRELQLRKSSYPTNSRSYGV
jgi:hypothetical protein